MHEPLFASVNLGALSLRNRIVMSPMTRGRAGPDDVPSKIMAQYYAQRASAGLIVTEGVQPSAVGKGYWRTPGIHTPHQVKGWSKVSEAVHARGGLIVMQLMHCGRAALPQNRSYDADIVAPSAIVCPADIPGPEGVPAPPPVPRALDAGELPQIAQQYADAAKNAIAGGLDGVELHCASGYLINQFLNPASNQRSDEYGGNPKNRIRFPVMVLRALADAVGADRVGFRISPGNPYNGMDISDPWADFAPFLEAASSLNLAYVHLVDMGDDCPETLAKLRRHYSGNIIANNMLTGESGTQLIASGHAEAVSFGRAFISNPDLPERLRKGAELAKPDFSKLYVGEELGYCDYPALSD